MHPLNRTIATHRRLRVAAAGLLLLPLSLAACGDDEGASPEYEAFCDANLEIDRATFESGDDMTAVEDAMAAIVEAAPNDDTRQKVQNTIDAFMALEGPPDSSFYETYGELVEVVEGECGFHNLSVTAKNYEFDGIDDELEAGPTLVTFVNAADEFHEVLLMRRNDGDDTDVAELLAMEEGEAMSHVTPIGGAFAPPGITGWTSVDLEPGRYIAVCFIPTGATEEAWAAMMTGGPEVDGMPHAMQGMTAEFEVTS